MAELGAIANNRSRGVRAVRAWDQWTVVGTTHREDGTLSGNVKTAGVNEPLCRVLVLNRHDMRPVAVTWTDASGNWSVSGLDPDFIQKYVVVIQDPATGSLYNDGIFAQVTPVAS